MKVGVFDSGIGGLNILAEMIIKASNNEYIYYADNLNMPYGTKSESEINSGVKKAMDYFCVANVSVVVVGCNTACCVASSVIKQYPFTTYFVTESLVKQLKTHDKVLCFATMNTVSRLELLGLENVRLIGLPTFAKEIECVAPRFYRLFGKVRNLTKQVESGEIIALGCTHYTYFKPYFESLGYTVIAETTNLNDLFSLLSLNNETGNGNKNGEILNKNGDFLGLNDENKKINGFTIDNFSKYPNEKTVINLKNEGSEVDFNLKSEKSGLNRQKYPKIVLTNRLEIGKYYKILRCLIPFFFRLIIETRVKSLYYKCK